VVLVCDCNSHADGTGTVTYSVLVGAGFDDVWAERHPHRPGFTCCQDEDLRNSRSGLDQRIDLLVRGRARWSTCSASVLGSAARPTPGCGHRTTLGSWRRSISGADPA
jgi:hypothetical protein